jgi:hypothetical protein
MSQADAPSSIDGLDRRAWHDHIQPIVTADGPNRRAVGLSCSGRS